MNENKIYILNLRGSLDSVSAADFKKYLGTKVREGHTRFLLQLDELDFVTSFGISFLLKMQQEAEEGKYAFALTGLNEEILALFSLLGIVSRLPLFASRKEAQEYLQSVKEKTGSGFSFHNEEDEKSLYVEESMVAGQVTFGTEHVATEKNEAIHHYSTPEEKSEEKIRESGFSETVIFCESCNARLRIKRTGRHRCPDCATEFDVRANGSVTWLEKLLK